MSDEPKNLPEDFYRQGGSDQPPQPAPPTSQHNPYEQAAPWPGQSDQGGQPPQPPAYGQPGYGEQPAYGQPGSYPPAGYGAPGQYAPQVPSHPSATTSMVLGIVSLAGILFCGGFTLVLSPFAWVMGRKAVREIDANPGQYSGRDQARGGQIMGIIGTVLLVIGIILVLLMIIAMVAWWDTTGVVEPTVEWESGLSG